MSFRANVVSRGIHPSCRFYLALVLSVTWWIPPLRLRCGRNDRRFWFGCYKCKRITFPDLRAGWRQIAAATPDSSYVIPFYDTAQKPKRGGRQVAAPTIMYHVFCLFRTQYRNKNVKITVLQHKTHLFISAAFLPIFGEVHIEKREKGDFTPWFTKCWSSTPALPLPR